MEVNGVAYNVEVVGEGPPLLLLHGFTGSLATWSRFVRSARGRFTTIAVDLLGHGASDVPHDPARYDMSRWAADLYAILDDLGHSRAAAVGYSMGGRLLLCAACNAPERFTKLVLEGATPGIADSDEREAQRATDDVLASALEQHGIAHFVDLWEKKLESHKQPRAIREALHEERLRCSPRGLANTLRGVGPGAQPPQHDHLGKLQMPTLLVVGEEDQKFRARADELERRIHGAQIALVPGAGHTAHVDQPDAFDRIVLEFLG